MMKKILSLMILFGMFALSSCDFDQYLEDPNNVNLSGADVNFLMTRIQTNFATFFEATSQRGARATRIIHRSADTYEIAYSPTSLNFVWSTSYANLLNDINLAKELASEAEFRYHLGILKTLEAYTWLTLVDFFGDVPFSQAFDTGNFNPNVDGGSGIYSAALNLLNEAKADFQSVSIGSPVDFYYGRNYGRWIKLVNTLQLKYHLNRKLIDQNGSRSAIDALITEDNFLGMGDDFVWKYGSNVNDPDTRSPYFSAQFPNGGGDYQSTFFMWHLTEAKGFDDPRASYYFYRQTGVNPTTETEIRCINEFPPAHYPVDMVWCLPGTRGYWGRDHLDPQGIPPDGLRRTLFGLYPAGGSYDNDTPGPISAQKVGNGGAGIEPIMLSAYVDFMLAEAALTLNTSGDPGQYLLDGARKHINYVRSWSLGTGEASTILAHVSNEDFETARNRYLNYISDEYNGAGTTTNRMRVIAREYWISLFGNGVEAINLYRRTGQPDGMQPGQIANFGKFPRSFFYPLDLITRNSSVDQKPSAHETQVFWDTNPAGFID
jgi:hypothetical protein